ncbi:hypothetical protein ACFVU2_19445 [Leifsonia sp. NPDC058194]|uniref:hypothetical protein n=1 Tax=Leifsonia sp. NPDC058194 TaxID=3346374 RepID=UPI0036DB709B
MTTQTITAYLADGRHVEVPESVARDWAHETQDLTTTDCLADWYLQDGENDDEITGVAEDDPRCDHDRSSGDVIVTNASQANGYDKTRPIASTRVCPTRTCILDALAWVERTTGEHGVWIGDDRRQHVNPPAPTLVAGSKTTGLSVESEEFSAAWSAATEAEIDLITDYAELVLGPVDTLT